MFLLFDSHGVTAYIWFIGKVRKYNAMYRGCFFSENNKKKEQKGKIHTPHTHPLTPPHTPYLHTHTHIKLQMQLTK